jgi:hypothetical protein
MKFYICRKNINFYYKIIENKLSAIYSQNEFIIFFKYGMYHNSKNAAYVENNGYKEFILNDITFGCAFDFAKKSWRRFCKLQAFL